ncbi:hypothetical protein OW492_00515 [Psychromonas sp. 14N.309.X.WAT.B.A12]|uniref:hypothetical protein n=1 Tax=Psychromonas sp. 14N.309.X.WAT.B.A12 TaxID=2998322 RepID=UPI0025B20AD1|nr:hypothetical protein [Psychromonas sp. 14N.309.X.WAT.B.A12]MDN2661854.1 hypothetical protein [Psychromonas sp. 14N.309.X.WAT.B.A12]
MKTYPTKFFGSNMQGAPQISEDSAQGQVAALLKAVLVDGFGSLAPDSIVFDAESSLAKATFSSGHSYVNDSVLLFEGVIPSDYNGEHRVISITSTEVYFELDDGVSPIDATVTGSVKVAPLGWSISYSDANNEVIIFTSAGDLGNVHFRIDNSAYDGWSGNYARLCKVSMVENVTDIDTYDEIYSHCWPATARYSSKNWNLVGDNRIFYYMMQYGAKDNFGGFVVGYIDSLKAGDRYHFIMNHVENTNVSDSGFGRWDQSNSSNYDYYTFLAKNHSSAQNRIARKYHQLEGVDTWMKLGMSNNGGDTMPLPNPVNNGFYINTQKQMVMESDSSFRGYMPLLVEPLSEYSSLHGKTLDNLPELEGSKYVFFNTTKDHGSDISECLMGFDISTQEG